MGIEPSPERVKFLQAWAQCEGGTARYNPLNTTFHLPGATRYNSVGVQNYEDHMQGLAGTLATIRLPYYSDLRKALAQKGLSAAEIARRSRASIATWGTDPGCVVARAGGHAA
jgi:hypothetical protein